MKWERLFYLSVGLNLGNLVGYVVFSGIIAFVVIFVPSAIVVVISGSKIELERKR